MENRKKIIIIAIFLVLSLCVTVVATVAFFNYAKEGATDNVIETGTIEFHYDEVSKKGNGIELIDALPVASNDTEKTNNTYFEFNITAKTMSLPISYVVTAKKSVDSDDMDDLDVPELNNLDVGAFLTENPHCSQQQIPIFVKETKTLDSETPGVYNTNYQNRYVKNL